MNRVTNILKLFALCIIISCNTSKKEKNGGDIMKFTGNKGEIKLITIDPGHFHAALVQKVMYDQVSPVVFVYAPAGPDVENHLKQIENFNTRPEDPTSWETVLYKGNDFLEVMLTENKGNVMVTAGNNNRKTEYIKLAIDAGINVLADKPIIINSEDFEFLQEILISAEKNKVLLYDIMTERYEITTILQKELSNIPEIFGELTKGSPEDPAVTKESVHHFFKYVSGSKIKRPAWFFDVSQQGEGIVDVTTHLVDLIQWECFSEQIINYKTDIEIINTKRWSTMLTPLQFESVTRLKEYPDYLLKDIVTDSILNVYSNGEIRYKIKGIFAKVSVTWNYEAPEGAGDTHFSIMKGSISNLVIRQGKEQNFKPVLYIEPVENVDLNIYEETLGIMIEKLANKYEGITLEKLDNSWQINIPDKYKTGHEAHFGQVTEKYLQYLIDGKLPDWEVPNMIAKYYTTTKALELAKNEK